MPLAFWSLHRLVGRPSVQRGLLAGLFLFLQVASCVYYGVFLALALALFVLLYAVAEPRRVRTATAALAWTGVSALLLIAPYAWPYVKTAASLGPRSMEEVARYSATPLNYLAAPPQSWLWGWTAARFGRVELSLYPGGVTVLLAFAAAFARSKKLAAIYACVALFAIEMSFGLNGSLYSALVHFGLTGLRAPARATMVALCALSVLAALGTSAVQRAAMRLGSVARLVPAVVVALVGVDFANSGMFLMGTDGPDAPVYAAVRSAGPGPVVDLPVPLPEALPGRDPSYEYWSMSHWHPLVNGYSGYYPAEYVYTLELMRSFPDDRSIARLKSVGARYVVVHRAFYENEAAVDLLLRIGRRPELQSYGAFKDPVGMADLFVLR
jgi:hypothetical protein